MSSENQEIAELARSIESRRPDVSTERRLSESFDAKLERIKRQIDDAEPSAEQKAHEQRLAEAHRQYAIESERRDRINAFLCSRGRRYRECTFESYQVGNESQANAVDRVRSAVASDPTPNVVLYGARGTGKDHLMVAAIRELLNCKIKVTWTTGMDLFGDIRDRMEKRKPERDFIEQIGSVDLLAISDPIPVSGAFTEHQANMLYRIVDYRYSRLLPIWVTINVSDGSEFDTKLGAATADRIRDGATVIKCDWPSFRRANQ